MNKYINYAIIAILVINLFNLVTPMTGVKLGGTVENFPTWFTSGIKLGSAGNTSIGSDGSLTLNSGTAVTNYKCATASWNPPAVGPYVSSTSSTSTDILLTGSVMGDLCKASITSATSSSADVVCNITSTGTSTIVLYNIGTSALDLATGTAKVCYTH